MQVKNLEVLAFLTAWAVSLAIFWGWWYTDVRCAQIEETTSGGRHEMEIGLRLIPSENAGKGPPNLYHISRYYVLRKGEEEELVLNDQF